jgi:tetratricopeptide (TPR) repeat protein
MSGSDKEELFKILKECKQAMVKATTDEKAKIFERMGDAYKGLDKGNKAIICYQESYDAGNLDIDFIEKFASDLGRLGRGKEALEMMEKALDRTDDPLEKARLYAKISFVSRHTGKYDKGIEMGKKALKIISTLDRTSKAVKRVRAEANNVIGLNLWRKGNVKEALPNFKTALELFKEVDYKLGIADALNHMGLVHFLEGEPEKAIEYHKRSLSVVEKTRCYNNIGIAMRLLGEFEDAENYYKKAITRARQEGDNVSLYLSQINLANIYLDMENKVKARTWVDLAYMGFQEIDKNPWMPLVIETLARVSLLEGNLKEAFRLAVEALEMAKETKSRTLEANILQVFGLIAKAKGQPEEALRYLTQALDLMKELKLVRYQGECYLDLALVHRELGQEKEAKKAAAQARKLLEKIGARFQLERMKKLGL